MKRPRFTNKGKGAGFGPSYSFMRFAAECCNWQFFRHVSITGGEDIPKEGPIILVATHFATLMDTSLLSAYMPHRRKLHYWAKKGLYSNPIGSFILNDSGNIQVDRKTKNNQALFAGTFEALKAGECIALFPEGGSFTEPHLHAMKAGAAWAALEYAKNLQLNQISSPNGSKNPATNLTIVPAGINFTSKSRYRSSASVEWGPCFFVDDFTPEFLKAASSSDEAARSAVAKLTEKIGDELRKLSINAPEWITWHAMKVGRELIWQSEDDLPVQYLRPISNDLVTILAPPHPHIYPTFSVSTEDESTSGVGGIGKISKLTTTKESGTNAPIQTTSLNAEIPAVTRENFSESKGGAEEETQTARDLLSKLSAVCVGCSTELLTLNALADDLTKRGYDADGSLPPVWLAAKILTSHSMGLLLRAPYLVPIFALHAFPYAIATYCSTKYASHEEESMACVKSLVGYGFTVINYSIYVWLFWAASFFTPIGLIVGLIFCYAIMHLHHAVIDDAYDRLKLVLASTRLLMASLGGESWQLDIDDPQVKHAIDTVRAGAPIQDTINLKKKKGRKGRKERPFRARLLGVALRLRQDCRVALRDAFDAVESRGTPEQKAALQRLKEHAGVERLKLEEASRLSQAQRLQQRLAKLGPWKRRKDGASRHSVKQHTE